jgi:hypothetical protein
MSRFKKGDFITGDAHPVEQIVLLKRDRIQKGMFLHGGDCPTRLMPKAPSLGGIAERVQAATQRLEEIRRMVAKK